MLSNSIKICMMGSMKGRTKKKNYDKKKRLGIAGRFYLNI